MNSKNKLSLGIFAATALVWLFIPLVGFSASFMGVSVSEHYTSLEIFGMFDMCGFPDFLMLFAPIAAIVLGVLGIFKNPSLSKTGGFVGAGGMLLSLLLYMDAFEALAVGFWLLFLLMAANLAVCFMPER